MEALIDIVVGLISPSAEEVEPGGGSFVILSEQPVDAPVVLSGPFFAKLVRFDQVLAEMQKRGIVGT